jgi:L-lactate dehydrogenase (cytochrome)
VEHAIGILASEIMRNMALIGVQSPTGVSRRNLFESAAAR